MEEKITLRYFLKNLVTALNDGGFSYMVIGGIAAIGYGRSRSTIDCDIALSLDESELDKFYSCMKSHGFEIREYDLKQAFKEKTHFNAFLPDAAYRADFSWRNNSLTEWGFKRAEKKHLLGVTAIFEQAEDIIIAKLVYGSQQDIDDAKAILDEQKGTLDKKYLEKRAEEEGVKKKLDELYK